MRGMKIFCSGLLLVSAAFLHPIAFAQSPKDNDNIAWIEGDDPEMADAVIEARAGLPGFFERMKNPAPDESGFVIKFNLAPKGDAEFIWAGELKRKGKKLTGILSDEPFTPGFKTGQRVTIAEADIIDWSYYKGRVAQGHATTKVLFKHMRANEVAEIRRGLGWGPQ